MLDVDLVYRSGFSPTHILFFVGLKPDLLTPGGGYTNVAPTKQGSATCKNIWYIVTVGDCSVRTAMKNGGIRTLSGYDVQRENILGFQTITVKAWGN